MIIYKKYKIGKSEKKFMKEKLKIVAEDRGRINKRDKNYMGVID